MIDWYTALLFAFLLLSLVYGLYRIDATLREILTELKRP